MVVKTDLEKEIKHLFGEIKKLQKGNDKSHYLLENTYFLEDGRALCLNRENGVSRFPYGMDGFTLWAYSSGYISINESTFYLVLPSEEGKEPYLAFYAGEKQKDGSFIPISLLGRGKNVLEKNVERFCIYGKDCVYFLTKTKNCYYGVRIFVTNHKQVSFSVYAHCYKNQEVDIYLSSFMNCLFKYANGESMETKWFKKCQYADQTFSFESPEDIDRKTHVLNFGVIHREYVLKMPNQEQNTTSRSVYVGGKENALSNALPLMHGTFKKDKLVTHFTDTAVAGDLLSYHVKKDEKVIVHYTMTYTHQEEMYHKEQKQFLSFADIEELLKVRKKELQQQSKSKAMLHFDFSMWNQDRIHTSVLNRFLEYVIYQTEYCGLAKNSGALFLGVRDVMQQIEAALIWNPKACRKKILEVLSFIDSSGNPPRQYSIPPENVNPAMDLRDFIDQGVWIISTIYTYLSYTGDYGILKETIGYYDRVNGGVVLSKRRDTVLDHMLQIMDYLMKHIDPNTKCLRAMYGDWNDALDGLGVSSNPHQLYGNGVSVMASFQFYMNLNEMIDLLSHIQEHVEYIEIYDKVRKDLVEGIKQYAIVEKDRQKKILHGWGENRSYFVGSFADVDGESRDSLTANAFYVLSGFSKLGIVEKDHILKAYQHLDSKYGLRTFAPYFKEDVKGVGRIVHLPKGTAENGATYIHATLFAILSLFMMGEEKKAYEQLEKALPITHEILTTTPFVMPNSYSYNEEEDMDGESMSDWYTGSANTLIKTLIKGAFGIFVSLDGVSIDLRSYIASKKATCSLKIRNANIRLTYEQVGQESMRVFVNGNEVKEKKLFFAYDQEGKLSTKNIEIVVQL